jgi:phosphopantothenoylcysteine decarboxylase / phosphopantothenate---cysteine ligase
MRVALGVSGGVAAYKAAELVRRLQQERLDVQVVMTRAAQEFVTPLTFAALSGEKVITDLFPGDQVPSEQAGASAARGSANIESAIEHIAVAQRIDALVIAPATANVLAKMARGIADDFLTTLYLATTAPVIVAPAMNVNMWEHAATQENIEMLRARGVHIVAPDEGYLACGMTGAGRLAGVEAIAQAVCATLGISHDLAGETVLITAGPTCEDIDPVRFLTNRSSGRMGYALADAAARRGARVVLVSGPTALSAPANVERIDVRSAEDMRLAVLANVSQSTIVIMAAAVADYRPIAREQTKIKRGADNLRLELEPTPDILAEVARENVAWENVAREKSRTLAGSGRDRLIIGFAAETDHVAEHARRKLAEKAADLIVANDVTAEGAGFDHDTNVVTFYGRNGAETPLPRMSKFEVAQRILDEALALRRESSHNEMVDASADALTRSR